MGNRVKLEELGKRILESSRTELVLSMRFLGPALHSLGFVMDLSTTGVGTDAAFIRFNPNYLFRLYVERPRALNRTYLHILLHCIFRHMFTAREREDRELWDLSCDIAVEAIIDSMDYGAVAEATPERRRRVYDALEAELNVLTAERIYQYFLERKRNYLVELQLRAMFAMCDHSFWERMEEDDDPSDDAEESGRDQDKKPDGDGRSGPGEDEGKDPDESRSKKSEKDSDADPDGKELRDRGKDADKEPDQGQRRKTGKDSDADPDGKELRDRGKDADKEPGRDADKKTDGDGRRESGRDAEKGADRERDGRRRRRGSRRLRPLESLPELEKRWKDNSKRMEAEILSSGKEGSGERGSLDRILSISNRSKTDYREFLRKFAVLREVATIDPDSFDYGFYNYGLEVYGNMPLIEENEYCEMNRIRTLVIAIDTSASCQDVLVQRFINETAAVLRSIGRFFKSSEVHIIECDEHVQQVLVVKSPEELERYADAFHVKGGFGTDFRPVFSYVEEKRKTGEIKDLEGLMYFTDGMGIYPEKPTDYDTAFVFFNDEELDDSRVPDWAVRLYIKNGRAQTSGQRPDFADSGR